MTGQQRYRANAGFGFPRGGSLSPFADRLAPVRAPPRFDDTVTIGGRRYRVIDYQGAQRLVPLYDPEAALTQGRRRQDLERLQGLIESPFAGATYGLLTALGAAPRVRERAVSVAGAAEGVLQGVAPVGVKRRPQVVTPRPQQVAKPVKAGDIKSAPSDGDRVTYDPAAVTDVERDRIRFGALREPEQATYASSTITPSQLGQGTRANSALLPPGWSGNGDIYNEGRGHLLANQLGGTGDDMRNIVTLTQNPTNSSGMATFEGRVARRVRDGEVVEYFVQPLYGSGSLAPGAVLMMEYGSRGGSSARIVNNPAGAPR